MKRVLIILMMVLVFAGCGKSGNPVESGVDEPVASPARWTQTPAGPLALPAGRQEVALNRVGCFQKMACEHEDGRTFVVMATESSGAPGTVYRLAISESANIDKEWSGIVGDYNTAVETTIVNGYEWQGTPVDEITDLREWSAVIREDKILIALLASDNPTLYQMVEYNIDTQTYSEVVNGNFEEEDFLRCIDIAASEAGPLRSINQRNIGHGSAWFSFSVVDDFDPTSVTAFQLIYLEVILASVTSADDEHSQGRGFATVQSPGDANMGQHSLFDGGNSIYSVECFKPSGNLTTHDLFYFRVWNELLTRIRDFDNLENSYYYFYRSLISGAIDQNNLLYDFGAWDACYIDFYNYQIQAKWIRASSNTGWDLYIGRRDQNGVFNAQLVKTVDYANIGLLNIETQAENVGAFPEVVLSTDEQGYVYCMFMYPDETNNDVVGGGLGDLNGDPYTNIEMVTMDGNQIYDPQNLDVQNVWNGFQDATYRSLKHMSTTHRTDSQDFDVPSDRRLWLTVRDNVNDTRIVLFRN